MFLIEYLVFPIATYNALRVWLQKIGLLEEIAGTLIGYANIAYVVSSLFLLLILIQVTTIYRKGSFSFKKRKYLNILLYEILPLLFSFIIVIITYINIINDYADGTLIYDPFFNLLLTTILLSAIAVIKGFNHAQYPYIIVKLKDNSLIGGILWKHNEYVHLLTNDTKAKINNDCIKSIEQSSKEYET
jgi:hypothetical protein